jgi:K+-sensing histidine kinase KdpD
VKTHCLTTINGADVIQSLLEAAQMNGCGTVVVGRQSHAWRRELSQYQIADELVRKGEGFTVWVAE